MVLKLRQTAGIEIIVLFIFMFLKDCIFNTYLHFNISNVLQYTQYYLFLKKWALCFCHIY